MIYGHVRDDAPHASLLLPGIHGDITVDFIVDTGLTVSSYCPPEVLNLLETTYLGEKFARLPGAGLRLTPSHEIQVDWQGDLRSIEVLVMDGRPLMGMLFLRDMLIQI